jgi:hypothetical protein
MKRTTFIAAGGAAAALAGAAGGAVFADEPQAQSDYALRTVRAQIASIIAALETEQADYGGHRVNAVNDYKQALAELTAALEVHGESPNQQASDHILREAQNTTTSLINTLKNAKADYSGHRMKAITDLQSANSEIAAALSTR